MSVLLKTLILLISILVFNHWLVNLYSSAFTSPTDGSASRHPLQRGIFLNSPFEGGGTKPYGRAAQCTRVLWMGCIKNVLFGHCLWYFNLDNGLQFFVLFHHERKNIHHFLATSSIFYFGNCLFRWLCVSIYFSE